MSRNKDKKNREKIDTLFKEKWQGKSVALDFNGTDIKVEITSQTRRHFTTMNNMENRRSHKARLKYILSDDLLSLLTGARYIKSETEKKNGQNRIHRNTAMWHYFTKNIQSDNKTYEVIFNIRESSQIQDLYVLHSVSFKEASLQNQQTLNIKKSQRATSAYSANLKNSSASNGSLPNNNQSVNINFEKYFSQSVGLYLIPYNDTFFSVNKIEEIQIKHPTLNYEQIGWNDTNYAKILPVKYWIYEDYLAQKQDDWLNTHGNLNDITYADTLTNSDKLKDLCRECKQDISEKIALAALIIGGFSNIDENVDEINQLVMADIDQDNFSKSFTSKVKNIIEKDVVPSLESWINQLPDEQIWAKDLAKNAKGFFDNQGEGRIGVNVKEYIENCEDIKKMEGTRIEINDSTRQQLKSKLHITAEPKQKKIEKEKNKEEEL